MLHFRSDTVIKYPLPAVIDLPTLHSLKLQPGYGIVDKIDSQQVPVRDSLQHRCKLEIWGKAQRESARRPKSDWEKLRGG